MPRTQILTSESVAEGHPDKMADQISDSVLDAALEQDRGSRVACETLVKTGMVVLAGEVRTKAHVEYEGLVRERVRAIGYDDPAYGFDGDTCAVLVALGQQSADIALGVDEGGNKGLGAGDQGMMFGYATRETDAFLPAPITLAHRLMRRHAEVRRAGALDWLRPDAKSQVTVRYEDGEPAGIEAVVLSAQHREDVGGRELEDAIMEEIIRPVLPAGWLGPSTRYHVNPTGRFVVGGPVGDCGLTGRKIIVDTYGGLARHGGGAFSGKDPSKVDRSAAYACRYVAKNVVAAGLADRCEVQVAYAIGVSEPVSVDVETFGTARVDEARLSALVREHFDLRPGGIIEMLDLARPIYRATAAFGHFGRDDPDFTWERTDRAEALADAAGRPLS